MIVFEKLRNPIKMNYCEISEIIKNLLGQLQDLKPQLELARGKEAWVMQEGQDSEIVEDASKEAFNKFLRIIGSAQKNAHRLFDIIPNPLIENILGNLCSLDQPLSAVCFMDNNTGRASLQEGYIEDYINCKKDTLATLRQLSQELSEISPPLVIWQNIISEIRSIGSQSATHKYSRIEGPPGPYNKIREEIAGLLNDIESAQKICIQVSENATTALVKLHHRVSDTKDLVNRNFCKGETPPQKLKSIQDDLSQAFKKIEMEYRDLLEEFAVEFEVAHIKFVKSVEAEQSASQKPARAGQGNTVKNLAEKTGQTPAGNIIARPVEAGQSNKAKRLRDIARNLSVWKESGPEGPENSKEARESAEEAMKLLRSNEGLLHYCKETYGFKYRQSESSLKSLYDILDYMRINDEAPEFITERTGYCDYQDFAQDHLINELNRWANEILQETEPQEKGGQSSGGNISGMRWQDAQKKAERIVNESESGFQGFMKLKKAVGCAKRTLTKAIKESPILTKAKSQYDAMSSTLKAVGVTPKVLATYKEKSEGPQLTNIEVEEILAEMMQQVEEDKPAMLEETKLNIKNMNPIQKHNLAKVYQEQYKSLKKHYRTHKDEKRTFFSEPKEPHQHKKV